MSSDVSSGVKVQIFAHAVSRAVDIIRYGNWTSKCFSEAKFKGRALVSIVDYEVEAADRVMCDSPAGRVFGIFWGINRTQDLV